MSGGQPADPSDRTSADEGEGGDESVDRSDSSRLSTRTPHRGRRRYDQADGSESSPLGPFVVALVGGSAGLIGLQADAMLHEIGLLVLVGAAVGAGLWWYLRRLGREMPQRRRGRRPGR